MSTLDDVQAFYRTHYHPSNAILSISADFDEERMLDLAEKWFAPLAYARMVFVAVCTAQQKAGTVEAEWSFFHKFKMAESESLDGFLLLSVVLPQ